MVTNDGAAILRSMEVQHPAAQMLAELAKAQDQEVGDGTKSTVILAGELLSKADELLDEHVHPTRIVEGYRRAAEVAVERLRAVARPVGVDDAATLHRIATTSMGSKAVAGDAERLAKLAVGAVLAVGETTPAGWRWDRRHLQIVKRPGEAVGASELLRGHLLEKHPGREDMPKLVEGARIALLVEALEVRKPEVSTEIRITDPAQVERFLEEERRLVAGMVASVVASGARVLFVEKGIDDGAAQALADARIYAVARVARKELEMIARATGARLVDRAHDLAPADLGAAGRVEERLVGEDRLTFLTDCPHPRAVTLLLRGGTPHVVDEVERSVVDAVSAVGRALEDGAVLPGAGATAAELSLVLRNLATSIGGREQLSIQAFGEALDVIPRTLAESAGMDPIDALIELRRRHAGGEVGAGVDVPAGKIADVSGACSSRWDWPGRSSRGPPRRRRCSCGSTPSSRRSVPPPRSPGPDRPAPEARSRSDP